MFILCASDVLNLSVGAQSVVGQSLAAERKVLLETYANIRILIQSEKTATSSSDRTLLKNLGIWLGSITLARNKPILHKVGGA